MALLEFIRHNMKNPGKNTVVDLIKLKIDIENTKIPRNEIYLNPLDSFKSMLPGTVDFIPRKIITNRTLVEYWLSIYRKGSFKNPESKFYGYERRFKKIAAYWLKHNEHNPVCNDPNIIYGRKLWDNYIKKFARVS